MPDPLEGPSRDSPRWWQKGRVLLPALFFVYPLGVVLLWRSRAGGRGRKAMGTILFAPMGVLLVLLLLRPYWDFSGSMSPDGFRLDFSKGASQFGRLEAHRTAQQAQPARGAAEAVMDRSAHWTDFRGPRRDGIVRGERIARDWSTDPPREVYRQPVGEGYASFTVADGRAYTIEQRRSREAVVCYDFGSGRELWKYEYEALFSEVLGGDGPRATPTLANGRVYSLGATGRLVCLDGDTGVAAWSRDVLVEHGASNLSWALAGSPLVIGGRVFVTGSGKGGASVLALDSQTGRDVWQSDAGVQGYSSLMLVELAGRRQLLNLAAEHLNGLDPESGRVLWRFAWNTSMGINCSQPVLAGDDRVFISSGYGKGCALLRVRAEGDSLRPEELWSNTSLKNKFCSSVIYGDHIYGLDEGVLCCLDLGSGRRRWKGGRYGHGSLLLAGDRLIVLSEQGKLVMVRASPERHQELGSLQALPGRTWNNFILLGGRLLARNHKEMVCYDLRPLTERGSGDGR